MHIFKNTVGFLAVFCAVPASMAVTARPSVIASASARMPTMTQLISGSTVSGTTQTTTSNLLANAECIDAYTACIKGGDACGPNFEECTTKVLFHGKMAQCLSTLAQCSTSGVQSLFGTGTVTALSTVATKNSYGEVTDYTYPTDGSVLGQLITGAAITNKYDTSSCVKRYTSCLKKDSVCGNDFELCTTNSEFKKQMVFCDSTLARCQSEGKIELFGSVTTTAAPSSTSRVGQMISEGAALAAINAVSTCYKVVDQCILNACAVNPYKCTEGASQTAVNIVNAINDGTAVDTSNNMMASDVVASSAVSAYIKNSCLNTIGANKYCYATFLGEGVMPTASQLRDEDNQEEIYDEAYASRMNSGMKAKIADLVDKFDTKAKQKCTETISACAMRVCGSGSGAACYSLVFGSGDKSINKESTRNEIKTGCSAIVNTDAYCKYAAQNPTASGTYSYTYINGDAFDILFPEYDADTNADPIGVVASLNANLATSYSDAAIAQMKKQCQSVATSCVKSLCGTDYVNCYRNRTDIYSSLTNTGNTTFDKSMNKVGGVLDYTIVLGLCLDTVKNADVCAEHLAIERVKYMADDKTTKGWGGATNVRQGWIDAGSATKITEDIETIQAVDENGNPLCTTKGGADQGVCYTVDAAGNIYDQPVNISYVNYVESQAANSLFKDLIYDLEKEAQAKYNAKLTKQQNMCMAGNDGGIMGVKDLGSTYMWVKLKNNKVPTNYVTNGLKSNQFVASNELYGSFCRIRVTLQSDDRRIQSKISQGADWSTAYFAAGDAFTCGSWIPQSALEEIANAVADEATEDKEASQKRTRTWLTVLGGLGSTVGGAYLGSGIQKGDVFGGLTGLGDGGRKNKSNKTTKEHADLCIKNADYVKGLVESTGEKVADVESLLTTLERNANGAGIENISNVRNKFDAWKNATAGDKSDDTSSKALQTALETLKKQCESADGTKSGSNDSGNKQWIGSTVGAVAVGVGGTLMVNKLIKSIQQSNLDKEQQRAYDEWMNSVGKHIHCYIGADEVANFGEVIQTSME